MFIVYLILYNEVYIMFHNSCEWWAGPQTKWNKPNKNFDFSEFFVCKFSEFDVYKFFSASCHSSKDNNHNHKGRASFLFLVDGEEEEGGVNRAHDAP